MADALVGFSGFVGGTLLKQAAFEALYRSTNIGDIRDKEFETLVCAGASAKKWVANQDPEADWKGIAQLTDHLGSIRCKRFVLISTVDVFESPIGVDEGSTVEESGLHAYGSHRRWLEKFVESHFPEHLIVRLPGLVGPGLQKNVIFDFLNNNNLHAIDSRNVFQFYPMVNLWFDIQVALNAGLRLVHLTSEPVCVSAVASEGFGRNFKNVLDGTPVGYDMRTLHASLFAGAGAYQYSAREAIQAVRAYAQSEPVTLAGVSGGKA
ncbi:pyridine nucleotide transhydrogenase [Rhodanobacter denitrificans]|uniref:pyridine nucleotide transhydrogenase n=1 Tax=Rhodanobacter denitrificans TaxID=666685 RepID=UPI0012089ED0|nr:pyridine nucleotide transhydrogenase [Rhodanobacter denitrificans]TAM60808.1 MAG: NAD(P)-dependent oxidoreductase [Rhodanobacter sp.]UJJ59563.1 pyridine nucleotide transhydrogenase [Rhodanobacter denitrificans]